MGLEGIISKRRDLPYQPGRRDGWRKIKCLKRGLFVIGGFTDQEGSTARAGRAARGTIRRQKARVLRTRRHRLHGGPGPRSSESARCHRAAHVSVRSTAFGPTGADRTLGQAYARLRGDFHREDVCRNASSAVVPGTRAGNEGSRRRHHRHLKIFSAIANGTTVHAAMIASSFQMAAGVAPSSTTARNASTSAVSGSTWMNG